MTTDLKLEICLPPGLLPREMVKEILRLVFDEYQWFAPIRYGFASFDKILLPGEIGLGGMLAYYGERQHLWVAARTDDDFIDISPAWRDDEYRYGGVIGWSTNDKSNARAWRETIVAQVKRLMQLVESPLAFMASRGDWERKTIRLVRHDTGYSQTYPIRDYSEGLAGVFWRNFYGPPFVRMFGDRLRSLPREICTDLGDDIVLVKPYLFPIDAESMLGKACEQTVIDLLGPECFYDHERHLLPTRRPDVSSLPQPKGSRLPKP